MQRQRWGVVPAISFDEMWTYQRARHGKKRQEVWIWTAVIELPDGRRCVDFEVGDRSGETFLRLYERLPEAERYYSDDYGVYGSWLPAERHIVGKGKLANRNEGLHSEYRGRLKRLARATTGYTKQVWVLRGSLALLCLRPRRGQKSNASACRKYLQPRAIAYEFFLWSSCRYTGFQKQQCSCIRSRITNSVVAVR